MKNYIRSILILITFILIVTTPYMNSSAQVGRDNLFCPDINYTDGMLNLGVALGTNPVTFSAGMVGIFRGLGNAYGGIDWMTTRGASSTGAISAPTNEIGSQLISWWSRKENRNTHIQITNHAENTGTHTSEGLKIHVRIFASDCTEIRDFCDTYTPLDTHVYDLSSLVTNTGSSIPTGNLEDKEGILIATPVNECAGGAALDEQAIVHNFLSGNIHISDTLGTISGTPLGYAYGTNMYARRAICIQPRCSGILDGSANARFDTVLPDVMHGLFYIKSDPPPPGEEIVNYIAGSDAVVMNFFDHYGPPYRPMMANSNYLVSIVDNNEILQSCGDIEACFLRLGIDSSMPARQDFTLP